MNITTDIRVRSKLAPEEMDKREGKCPGDPDYDVLLTGPTRVSKLDGKPLCVYLPGVLKQVDTDGVYEVLHDMRKLISRNRGMAAGSKRFSTGRKSALGGNSRTYARPISSGVAGALDPVGQQRYCRLTAWTGANMPRWELLRPLLSEIAGHFEEQVPDRFKIQMDRIATVNPAWVVPGTPFTTITVNNSYPTGTHQDAGDLAAGFSTIACLRRGTYTGGRLVFGQYRLAVDMGQADLLLMDAHEWHGNTIMVCACGSRMNGCCDNCGAERISIVSYMREKLVACGSPEEERRKADAYSERISAKQVQMREGKQ